MSKEIKGTPTPNPPFQGKAQGDFELRHSELWHFQARSAKRDAVSLSLKNHKIHLVDHVNVINLGQLVNHLLDHHVHVVSCQHANQPGTMNNHTKTDKESSITNMEP